MEWLIDCLIKVTRRKNEIYNAVNNGLRREEIKHKDSKIKMGVLECVCECECEKDVGIWQRHLARINGIEDGVTWLFWFKMDLAPVKRCGGRGRCGRCEGGTCLL